jgi:hypothetical protein
LLKAPFSSEFDPSEEAEGSIDPLGLQPEYDRLADRLLPAVTVRMGHPRFLTAMALGASVCEGWDLDATAADDITPPWLVWEWFVVEAFVRAADSLSGRSGVPGGLKVRQAINMKRPVCESSYLKTPSAFGFTGVFRRLARNIGILTSDGLLDDGGYELIMAWAKDQGLDGIIESPSGDGRAFRDRLRRAVSQGMEKGQTTYQSGDFWRELAVRLDPLKPGNREKKVMLDRIASLSGPPEMITLLKDAIIGRGGVSERKDEAPFIRKLSKSAPTELNQLLTAIDAYEEFGRSITNAFDGLRYCATSNGGAPVDVSEFSNSKAAKSVLATLGSSVARIRSHPTLLEWDKNGLAQGVERFEGVRTLADLFAATLEHHERVQRDKPPNGKRPWFDRTTHGKVLLRSGYTLGEPPDLQADYVHEYRIPTFSNFLGELEAF